MRQECLDSRFVFDRPLPVSRLVSLIGSSILIFHTCNTVTSFYVFILVHKMIFIYHSLKVVLN